MKKNKDVLSVRQRRSFSPPLIVRSGEGRLVRGDSFVISTSGKFINKLVIILSILNLHDSRFK